MTDLVQLAPAFERPPEADTLVDRFGRIHSDLRISVTDRCNIRCFYCMPEDASAFSPVSRLLSFDQIERVARVAAGLGVDKLRLTGGEPLLRPKLPALIERLTRIAGIRDIALTTNAVLLAGAAADLFSAGLRRLNIHLDTLDRARFQEITRRDELPRVLAGIEAAQRAGFRRIKLNAVAMKGISEPDLIPLVGFGREHGFEVRFIEFMPLDGQALWNMDRVLTADEMIAVLSEQFGELTPVPDADPRAPATEYQFADGSRVGFIASVTRPFCGNCNRLRLTSDGKLRYCLFAREESDIRPYLEQTASDEDLSCAIRANVWQKWAGHSINQLSFIAPERPMYAIGG